MYSSKPGLIVGFHGCDKDLCEKVVTGKVQLTPSENKYDWLGNGIYFWENNHDRALQFAEEISLNPRRDKPVIKTPAVLGALIDLGQCLDLMDSQYLNLLKQSYQTLEISYATLGMELPVNTNGKSSNDLLLRNLDCLVIESLHKDRLPNSFDSVRGVFWEGADLYRTAGFKEKNHVQICIRNPNCIKGYFIPRKFNSGYNLV